MREILFKGKRKDNGEWVEGLVGRPHVTDTEKGVESYYFHAKDEMGFWSQCTVSADTICQFTDLTDKNGNKIWENDIVLLDDEYWLVKWSDNDAQFTIEDDCTIENFGNVWGADCEVYGNIFDNADLLKGE